MRDDKTKDLYKPSMPEDPQASSVYLDRVMKRLKIDINSPENRLVFQWSLIVPQYLAQHCKCAGCRDGILYVVCENQAKAGLVRLNSRELIKNVNAAFPEFNIKKINIRVKT